MFFSVVKVKQISFVKHTGTERMPNMNFLERCAPLRRYYAIHFSFLTRRKKTDDDKEAHYVEHTLYCFKESFEVFLNGNNNSV